MGYRVGYQCFTTSEAAHDYLLSQQLPTITADGKIIRPEKQGQSWYLQGQVVNLSLPECDVSEQVRSGILFAMPLIILAVIVFAFNKIGKMIEHLTSVGGDDD